MKRLGFVFLLALAIPSSRAQVPGGAAPVPADPASESLLQAADLRYAGAFRVPSGTAGNAPPDSNGVSFDLAPAYGLAFNPAGNGGAGSLFISSKENLLNVAEIGIPDPLTEATPKLNTAVLIQGFADPSEGRFNKFGMNRIGGLLVAGSKLIFDGYIFYDATNAQTHSHFSRSTDLSATGSVLGPFENSFTATAGLLDGYMATIPSAWQALLGGTALTGNCCLSIIGRTSWGPAAFSFTPGNLKNKFPVRPLTYYTMEHPTLGNGTPTAPNTALFTLADTIKGVAMPDGHRSVLFFGVHGEGAICYGSGTPTAALDHKRSPDGEIYCYDPANGAKGQHAFPYRNYVWAYDARDLAAAAKSHGKQPWNVMPYATWGLTLPNGVNELAGVAYDAGRRRIYVAEKGVEQVGCCTFLPVIHVFDVR